MMGFGEPKLIRGGIGGAKKQPRWAMMEANWAKISFTGAFASKVPKTRVSTWGALGHPWANLGPYFVMYLHT